VALEDVIFRLQAKGWRILLAHPERFDFLTPLSIERLAERGVRMQMELGSLVGVYGDGVRSRAALMLEAGTVHVLATDLHRAEGAAEWIAAGLEAIRRRLGRRALTVGTALNPQRILDDAAPEAVSSITEGGAAE